MRFAFISFGGGALDYRDASSLGGSIRTIIPLVETLTREGHLVYWYGGRKNSHHTSGDQSRIHPMYDTVKTIRRIFNEAPKEKAFPGDDELSKSRTQSAYTIKRVRKEVRLPDVDAVWINFMDVGPNNIAATLAIGIEYLRRDVPVMLYDTDLRFRYRSAYGLKGRPATKYNFSYERFCSPAQAEYLLNLILLHQIRKPPTDGIFSRIETFLPVYDSRRELSIKEDPLWDVTYVGNDYMRRPWVEHWYGAHWKFDPGVDYHIRLIGNWRKRAPTFLEQKIDPFGIVISPPIRPDRVERALRNSVATIHLAPIHYATLGQITTRTREATAAGTAIITPREMNDAGEFTAKDYIVDSPSQARELVDRLREDPVERRRVVGVQRKKLERHSGLRTSYERLFELVKKYS